MRINKRRYQMTSYPVLPIFIICLGVIGLWVSQPNLIQLIVGLELIVLGLILGLGFFSSQMLGIWPTSLAIILCVISACEVAVGLSLVLISQMGSNSIVTRSYSTCY